VAVLLKLLTSRVSTAFASDIASSAKWRQERYAKASAKLLTDERDNIVLFPKQVGSRAALILVHLFHQLLARVEHPMAVGVEGSDQSRLYLPRVAVVVAEGAGTMEE
jgi:hypothetical protein